MDDTLLEKLDEMLTTYGVPHTFSLPREKTMEDCPEAVLEVAYDSSDDITFSLVYILFNKTYRGVTDKAVAESMIKVSAKYMDAE